MRNIATLSAVLLGLILFNSQGLQAQFNPLFVPDTLHGPVYNLVVDESKEAFFPGDSTNTLSINGGFLGPTLILRKGDFVTMNVTNNMDDSTTMHWHGMHVCLLYTSDAADE